MKVEEEMSVCRRLELSGDDGLRVDQVDFHTAAMRHEEELVVIVEHDLPALD